MAHWKSKDLLAIYGELMPRVSPGGQGRILEVGIASGESLTLWKKHFARVFGLDLTFAAIKGPYPDACLFQCDQHNLTALHSVADEIIADGGPLDMVIDDGAHTGLSVLNTWLAFWPIVKPGGVYCIEDWGTGYWPQGADGELVELPTIGKTEKASGYRWPHRFRSHDYGIPGVLKQLLDELASGDVYQTKGHNCPPLYGNIAEMRIICGYAQITKSWAPL